MQPETQTAPGNVDAVKAAASKLGFIDVEAARAFLGGCSRMTLYRKVNAGELRLFKLGSKTLFKIEDLEALPSLAGNDNASHEAA